MHVVTSPTELDLMAAARSNDAFRRVIETGEHEQVVLMTIPLGEDIGEEVHPGTDQTFIFVSSHGEAILDGVVSPVAPNDFVFVRAGTRHNIVNHGVVPMRLITVYAPPAHAAGTVHLTKADAEAAERD
jgi:mannose-6-phosphate isomerase-like protein (cupin superfamily)